MMKNANSLFRPDPAPLSAGVLILDETSLLEVAAVIDPMRAANRLASRTLFSWTVASAGGGPVRLTSGVLFPAQVRFFDLPKADLLIVIAGFNHARYGTAPLIREIRQAAYRFSAFGSVDSGGWILARAGLFAGHRATVHWEESESFAAAFPDVAAANARFVIDRNRFSAAGALAALDLMLRLIALRWGATLSAEVAGALLHATPLPGEQRQRPLPEARGDAVRRAIEVMVGQPDDPKSPAEAARNLKISRRTLEMRFRRETGEAPARYARHLRLQIAARLLRDTDLTLTEIGLRAGFASQPVFSRGFAAKFGVPPRAYRREFTTRLPEKE
jgi:transcriptional regulator GlxA family with amidase domain